MFSLFLLIILGFNGAVYLVLGEYLVIYGYHGYTSALLHACGAAFFLIIASRLSGHSFVLTKKSIRYYLICAVLGLIAPAVITFWVIPMIGTGMMAAVIATSPLFTVLVAHVYNTERFNLFLFIGILVGFVGTTIIILSEATWPTAPGRYFWLLVSLTVPFFLASGNVARTALWPGDLSPIQAGSGISIAAIPVAIVLLVIFETPAITTMPSGNVLLFMLAFFVLNGINAFPYFYLQRIGGPIYLSLLSHVMAFFGLLLGSFLFAESYRFTDILGVVLILIGVSTTAYFKHSKSKGVSTETDSLNRLQWELRRKEN